MLTVRKSVTALILQRPTFIFGCLLVGGAALGAIFAPWLSPFSPTGQDLSRRLLPPDLLGAHPLGTDALGRDVFSRILYGARVSLLTMSSATVLAAIVGSGLGVAAGYFERRGGTLIMGIADAQLALPFILLAIAVVATLGSSLVNVVIVLALSSWVDYARSTYGLTLSLRAREFVLAAHSVGSRWDRILIRHFVPHLLPTIVVLAILQGGRMILFESALSFLGMGVPPEIPTWGAILSDARQYLQLQPWLSVFPGFAIMLSVLGLSLVGEELRQRFNPREARQR